MEEDRPGHYSILYELSLRVCSLEQDPLGQESVLVLALMEFLFTRNFFLWFVTPESNPSPSEKSFQSGPSR